MVLTIYVSLLLHPQLHVFPKDMKVPIIRLISRDLGEGKSELHTHFRLLGRKVLYKFQEILVYVGRGVPRGWHEVVAHDPLLPVNPFNLRCLTVSYSTTLHYSPI